MVDRKAESRVFPSTKAVTVETLTHFVLANLRPESRLDALLSLHGASPLVRRHTFAALREVAAQQRRLVRHTTSE